VFDQGTADERRFFWLTNVGVFYDWQTDWHKSHGGCSICITICLSIIMTLWTMRWLSAGLHSIKLSVWQKKVVTIGLSIDLAAISFVSLQLPSLRWRKESRLVGIHQTLMTERVQVAWTQYDGNIHHTSDTTISFHSWPCPNCHTVTQCVPRRSWLLASCAAQHARARQWRPPGDERSVTVDQATYTSLSFPRGRQRPPSPPRPPHLFLRTWLARNGARTSLGNQCRNDWK